MGLYPIPLKDGLSWSVGSQDRMTHEIMPLNTMQELKVWLSLSKSYPGCGDL